MDEGALSVHQVKLVVKPERNQLKTHERPNKIYLAQASAMAVVLESMHTARCTFARSPPGITVGGW